MVWCRTPQLCTMHTETASQKILESRWKFHNHLLSWGVKARSFVRFCSLNCFSDVLPFCADLPGHGVGLVTEERVPKRLRVLGNSKDVFCLVKLSMSDTTLCQDPLLVYPAGLEASTTHFWGRVSRTTNVLQAHLEDDRKDELKALSKAFMRDFPTLGRSVTYYNSLLDDNRPRQALPCLKFVEVGPHAGARVGAVELGERPPPPKPHHLKVMFHRGWDPNLGRSGGERKLLMQGWHTY